MTYETTGSMTVDGTDLTDEEVISALESALANELDVHPSDIEIIYDSDTGVATYTITSEDAESLIDIINEIERNDFEIITEGISIDSISPSANVIVDVDVSIDASGVSDADTIVDSVVRNLQTQDPNFTVEGAVQFITSAPSRVPTVSPTRTPSTSIPSAAPSISGWVATITAMNEVSSAILAEDIERYTSDVAEFYGVDESDIEVTTTYQTTGSMSVTIPEDISENELTDMITSSIAESLGVHPSNVEVIVDMENGAVEFTITSDDFHETAGAQFDLSKDRVQEMIVHNIESAIPALFVDSFEVDDEVVASIEISVDANNAENDLTQAAWESEQLLADFDVDVKSNFIRFHSKKNFFCQNKSFINLFSHKVLLLRRFCNPCANIRSFCWSHDFTAVFCTINHRNCLNH